MRVNEPSKAETLVTLRGRKRAEDYANEVHGEACQYGHLGCAQREGGACSDEVAGLVEEYTEVVA